MTTTTDVSLTGRTTAWTVSGAELPPTWDMAIEAIAEVEPSPVYD